MKYLKNACNKKRPFKFVQTNNDEIFISRNDSKIVTTIPYIRPDESELVSAWSILLMHHKHYSKLEDVFGIGTLEEQELRACEILDGNKYYKCIHV